MIGAGDGVVHAQFGQTCADNESSVVVQDSFVKTYLGQACHLINSEPCF